MGLVVLQLVPIHQSCGGMSGDGSQSYAATVISAAKVYNSYERTCMIMYMYKPIISDLPFNTFWKTRHFIV